MAILFLVYINIYSVVSTVKVVLLGDTLIRITFRNPTKSRNVFFIRVRRNVCMKGFISEDDVRQSA